jgi:O-acetyl-ADP-ribose deacetylase (regulator of RNase III)
MTKIELHQGDITKLEIDAIVNAANKSLLGGGGVDGAIHRAAGPQLKEECRKLGGCETGEAKITKGYNLPAKYVIHTVGPIYGNNPEKEARQLADCYINSLKVAKENNIKSIAFPAISTGAYGYPKKEAAKIAIDTVKNVIKKFPDAFEKIIFVLFDKEDYSIYKNFISAKAEVNPSRPGFAKASRSRTKIFLA